MIFYLSTGHISFAPLTRSCESKLSRSVACLPTQQESRSGLPTKPSPKSMYRLADKVSGHRVRLAVMLTQFHQQLGLDDLAQLSLKNIKSQLTTDVIVHELFSKFTSRYSHSHPD